MNKIIHASFSIFVLMVLVTCKKGSDDPVIADYAATASGKYSGTYEIPDIGQVTGSMQLTKLTTTTVDIEMIVTGQIVQTLANAKVADGGSGKVNIDYRSAEGDLLGTVDGKTFNAKLISYGDTTIFTGTKP